MKKFVFLISAVKMQKFLSFCSKFFNFFLSQTEASFQSPSKRAENLIILDDKKEIKFEFAAELNNSLNTIALRANISTNPDKVISYINRRVKNATNDKIVKFLSPGGLV